MTRSPIGPPQHLPSTGSVRLGTASETSDEHEGS